MKRVEKIKQLNTEIDGKWFDVHALGGVMKNCDLTPKGRAVIENRIREIKSEIKDRLRKIVKFGGVRSSATVKKTERKD